MKTGGGLVNKLFSPTVYVFAALFIISFVLLLFSTRGFSVNIKNTGLSAFSGLRSGIHEATSFITRTILSIRKLAELREEHTALLNQMSRYEQLERNYAEIRQENSRLREQLGFSQTLKYKHIPAEIIGRDPNSLYSALVINKGSHSNVFAGMAVLAWQNGTQALVGKVIYSGLFESLVMPLYDSNSFVSSRLALSRFEGIVEGTGNPDQTLIMRYIQKRAYNEINIGDMVISSGTGGVYPGGINIGRINKINYQEYDISMLVYLEPVIDFSRLEYVFVIDPALNDGTEASEIRSETWDLLQ